MLGRSPWKAVNADTKSGDPKSLKQQMLGRSPWKAVKCGHEVRGPEVPKAANARPEPVESSKVRTRSPGTRSP
ncbi:hypothetical protein CRG98_046349 [Punica granatum]|uniref:Uncharacterized protein n=1 Tax=Punica granatum TaxID=22663 RepID=A0A2I0HP60_PUNGR|nr:hypothetical protein CRG98_046349 [Punica granatum]